MSLEPGNSYYGYAQQQKQSLEIFLRWINGPTKNGVQVGGKRYAMRFEAVGDASSKNQAT